MYIPDDPVATTLRPIKFQDQPNISLEASDSATHLSTIKTHKTEADYVELLVNLLQEHNSPNNRKPQQPRSQR